MLFVLPCSFHFFSQLGCGRSAALDSTLTLAAARETYLCPLLQVLHQVSLGKPLGAEVPAHELYRPSLRGGEGSLGKSWCPRPEGRGGAHPAGRGVAVLVHQGVGVVPDPAEPVRPVLAGVQQLNIVENGAAPVLQQDLRLSVLERNRDQGVEHSK